MGKLPQGAVIILKKWVSVDRRPAFCEFSQN
nr:MAG TPA: hypothetical protein [Caudoviricetes sp.]